MKIRNYKDLLIWKRGLQLSKRIYQLTEEFNASERYGLSSQMRRAAYSVPSNIAEGWARCSTRSFIQYLNIAKGSLAELDTYLNLNLELNYIKTEDYQEIENELIALQKMIESLKKSLQERTNR